MTYHHGDLRQAVIDAAAGSVERHGVAALSLRSLARELGVSHTAPRHHFGDKQGVVTALAAQGYGRLAESVSNAVAQAGFLESGVAYVLFAQENPGHFAVMFRPDLVYEQDPALIAARRELSAALQAGLASFGQKRGVPADPWRGLAAWSMAHGLAVLALGGALPLERTEDLTETARRALTHLG